MAASLFKLYTQFSSLKQPLADTIKRDRTANIRNNFIACLQYQNYYITPVHCKKAKRQSMQPVVQLTKEHYKLIQSKPKPILEIWKWMTVEEIANSSKRNIKNVLEALRYIDKVNSYNKNTVIEDISVICTVAKILGYNYKTIVNPNINRGRNVDYDVVKRPPPEESQLVKRHPVVTIMGHIDHGKTTLLDALRNTSVVDSEFGGITQHIGAFNVTLDTGEKVTFLDTPGHAAFNAMRARGANVTDIVVLVVAADDGVMEQTKESIKMARNANVPIIVAINKIDKDQANIQRTQEMLAANDVVVEKMGGEIQSVNISALKRTNLELLTETIILQAELMNLKGDPKGLVEGTVIECSILPGRGKVATVLIQRGTLTKGSILVCDRTWVKVRSMFDHRGEPLLQTGLSQAAQIIGWKGMPNVGDEILEVESECVAQVVMEFREKRKAVAVAKEHEEAADKKLQDHLQTYTVARDRRRIEKQLYKRIMSRDLKRRAASLVQKTDSLTAKLNIIVKGDVTGSVEAILDVLDTYSEHDKCHLSVVHYDVGPVTENDLELATVFDGIIYCFNVNVMPRLQQKVKENNMSVRRYNIIYQLIADVKEELLNRFLPIRVDEILGQATVLQEFEITHEKKKVKVAGCRCIKGVLKKSANFRVMRDDTVLGTGRAVTMKHLKDDVDTIKRNVECGIRLDIPVITYEPGDTLVCFETKSVKPELNWDPGF